MTLRTTLICMGIWRYSSTHCWSWHKMEVSRHFPTPAALTPGKRPRYLLIRELSEF